MSTEPLVVIPARLASSRLPGKPLKKIGGKPLINHCVKSCLKAGIVPFVTSDSYEVQQAAYSGLDDILYKMHGWMDAKAFASLPVTSTDLKSGTDRVAQFFEESFTWESGPDWIINVQGDMPFGTAPFIRALIEATKDAESFSMLTPMARLDYVFGEDLDAPDTISGQPDVDFERRSTWVHVGMYAWHKSALEEFYDNRRSNYLCEVERERNLEQMRGGDWDIKLVYVDNVLPPLEVNTQQDLDRINEIVNACAGFGHHGFTDDEATSLALAGGG